MTAALSGCHRAAGLDLVNGCDVPVVVYTGVAEPSAAAAPRMFFAEPGATMSTYFLDDAPAVAYIKPDGNVDWRGPILIEPGDNRSEVLRYEIADSWCE